MDLEIDSNPFGVEDVNEMLSGASKMALSVVCKYVHSKLDFGCFFLVVSFWMFILGPSLCGQGQGSAWFITLRVSFQIYNLV